MYFKENNITDIIVLLKSKGHCVNSFIVLYVTLNKREYV